MSLNQNTELSLVNTTTNSGTITLPSASVSQGRVLSFKDSEGGFLRRSLQLVCDGSDSFEDGTTSKILGENYGSLQLVASGTRWFVLSGNQQTMFSVSSMNVSTLNNINLSSVQINASTVKTNELITSFICPPTNLSFVTTSNLVPEANNVSIGNISSNYFQVFTQSTVTSNITAGTSALSTIFTGASITPAYSTNRVSTISLGTNTNRYFQGFFVSTITSTVMTDLVFTSSIIGFSLLGTTILSTQQIFCSSIQIGAGDSILDVLGPLRTQDLSTLTAQASTITAGTMTLDRLFGGTILASATTTQNLYPFNIGSQIGFYGGGGTASGGFYNNINVRSTNTQVITPDIQGIFSNVIFMRGNVSSQNLVTSTLSVLNSIITSNIQGVSGGGAYTSGNIYPQGTNILGFGTGGPGNGPWDSISVRQTFTSSIITNNISVGTIFNSNGFVSTINRKLYPYTSTLGIPASTFSLSGTAANSITNPLVLYSNVSFPHAGFFNLSQSAIFSRTSATANVPQASIFYTPGIYPSTTGFINAYANLPYLGNANASTFTTLSEIMYVSTTQLTRNIIYSDPTGNAYTANLFMAPIIIQYVPNNTLTPE